MSRSLRSLFIKTLALSPKDRVLDLGCGNGKITAFLAEQTGAHLTGLDISKEGILDARKLTCARGSLTFLVGNMNALTLPEGSFDAVVLIDTFYYAADPSYTLREMIRLLAPGGRMGIFFSRWIWSDDQLDMLQPDRTGLAQLLQKEGLRFTALPLHEAEVMHWDKKLRALEARREEFLAEGNEALYAYRLVEAQRYANWPRAWRTRFLYRVER